jgi:hypothetical protein
MYPEHDDTWLNGRHVHGDEARTVTEAREADRARDTARLLAGVITTKDRPGVVPWQVSPEEAVTVEVAAEGVL